MLVRPLVALGAVVLLSACSAQPPGAAAVVDGHTVSMQQADDAAQVYCRLTLVTAQGGSDVDNAAIRRQAVADLVLARVADDVARERGLEVPSSSYTLTPSQRADVARAVPALDAGTAARVVERSQRTAVIAGLLGESAAGQPADATGATQEQRSAGFQQLTARLRDASVRYDPRFGLTRASEPDQSATGSLSVGPAEKAATLPASQRCA